MKAHLQRIAEEVRAARVAELSGVVEALEELLRDAAEHYRNLEALEQRLSGLEDKMIAVARSRQTEQELMDVRAELTSNCVRTGAR